MSFEEQYQVFDHYSNYYKVSILPYTMQYNTNSVFHDNEMVGVYRRQSV